MQQNPLNIIKVCQCQGNTFISCICFFKQQIPKFFQDTLLYFTSKSLKIAGVLLYPNLLYFQIFENWWGIAPNYEPLEVIYEHKLNKFSKHMGAYILA